MLNIYVANLAKYNEGKLVGEWIKLPCDNLEDRISNILGNDEEYAIHDYETDLGIEIGEYSSPYELNEIAEQIEDLNDDQILVVKAFLDGVSNDINEAIEAIDNGEYTIYYDCNDMSDVALQIVEECGYLEQMPENLRYYFDYEKFGRDLGIEGTYVFVDNDCVEFHN